jgi:lipase chaperone LimK
MALLVSLVALGLGWQMHASHRPAAALQGATPSLAPTSSTWWTHSAEASAPGGNALTLDEVRARVMNHPTFQFSIAPGTWCVQDDKLVPCYGLRRKFEYFLLAIGIVSMEDIRRLVEAEARKAQGDALAAEIMKIWDKYRATRAYEPITAFDPQDRSTWPAVLQEQQAARRRLMGDAWAYAFFHDEEADLKAEMDGAGSTSDQGKRPKADPGGPVPQLTDSKDPAQVYAERSARYGQDAADRLAKLDDEWADWERRLEAARKEKSRLDSQAELSTLQRDQAMQTYARAHFKADEMKRVSALLHLP